MNTSSRPAGADRPIPELLGELSDELKSLVRDELELVRIEMSRKGNLAGKSAGMFGVASLFGLGAFAAMTATIVALLLRITHVWAAALIVTVVYAVIAGVAALRGRNTLQEAGSLVPERIAANLRRDAGAVSGGLARGR